MNPQKKLEKLITELVLPENKDSDQRILNDALVAYDKSEINKSTKVHYRRLVVNRITKFAAAIVIIAALFGLNKLGGSLVGANVALADVAKKLKEIQNGLIKKTTTISVKDNVINKFDSLVYIKKFSQLEEIYQNDKITSQVFVDFQKGVLVGINHSTKEFTNVSLTEDDVEKLSSFSPTSLVDIFLSNENYKNLGRKSIEGVLSEGFEFNDKRGMLNMDKQNIENVVERLWVDVNTKLPILIEIEGVVNNCNAKIVMYAPTWNVDLATDFFQPNIPIGYINSKERGFIGVKLDNWPALKVIHGRAAEKAGIKDGDIIIKVNNDNNLPESSDDAYNLFRGKIGEKVTLTVKRGEQIITFEIERQPQPN